MPSRGCRCEGVWGGRSGGLQNRKEGLARYWLLHTLIFVTWRAKAKVEESIKLKEDSIRLPTIQLNTLIQHVVVVKEKSFITISISWQKRVLHEQTDRPAHPVRPILQGSGSQTLYYQTLQEGGSWGTLESGGPSQRNPAVPWQCGLPQASGPVC